MLARDSASPVPPESDDENKKKEENKDKKDTDKKDAKPEDKSTGKTDDAKKKEDEKPKPTVIDLAGIGNRILSLPIPPRNYVDLSVARTGVLFLAEGEGVGHASAGDGPPIRSLWRFTTDKRKTEEVLSGLTGYLVSFDGEKLFYMRGDSWFLANVAELKADAPDAPQGKPVNNGSMMARLDPRAEWRQMYRETWHIERDFFYDPHLQGIDVNKIQARYEPFLAGLASRDEFTYLSNEMLGKSRSATCLCTVRTPQEMRRSPACWALTIPSRTTAIVSQKSTEGKIGRRLSPHPSLHPEPMLRKGNTSWR